MYKIFLVEDEIVVRESIRDSIPWEETEFIFAGEASDGEIALPLIQKILPDILITDIKMPFMDGLELSSFVKKTMPQVRIIMISGYQEFDFAKQAISIGIEEYVLKPVDSKELLNVLRKVAKNIEIEKKNLENLEVTNKYIMENAELVKEKVLNEVLMETIPPHLAASQLNTMKINLYSKHYTVMNIIYDVNQYWDSDKNMLLNLVIENITNQNANIIKFNRSLREVILIIKGEDPITLVNECLFLKEYFLKEAEKLGISTMCIGVGSVQDRIQGIALAYKELKNTESSEIVIQKYEKILQEELKIMNEDQQMYSKFNDIEILEALRCESTEGVLDVIERYFKKICDIRMTSIWSIYLAIRINLIYADFLMELGENAANIVPKQTSIEEIAVKLDTHEKLQKYVEEVCLSALGYRNQSRKGSYYEIVENAKKYIEENYSDPDISLNEVSTHIHMSACHFSTIFSHETSTTFIKYLTNIRIKKAKELLQTTNLKSGEIGFIVGYKDPHYFSYIFKKNTDCKPSEYKEQIKDQLKLNRQNNDS